MYFSENYFVHEESLRSKNEYKSTKEPMCNINKFFWLILIGTKITTFYVLLNLVENYRSIYTVQRCNVLPRINQNTAIFPYTMYNIYLWQVKPVDQCKLSALTEQLAIIYSLLRNALFSLIKMIITYHISQNVNS